MSLWLKRELFGIGTLAMLASTQAEENGTHVPPHKPAVFLTLASPLSHIAAGSEPINAALFGSSRNRQVCGDGRDSIEGFQFRCSTPMRRISDPLVHRNCRHVRLGLNPSVTISTRFLWLLCPKGSLWDFLGKKVTSSLGI